MEQKFKIGDLVKLKSGGPSMTIINDKHGEDNSRGNIFNGEYTCSWFDKNDEPQNRSYPQDSLEKVD